MSMHKKQLSADQLDALRTRALISSNEVAYITGDLLIAEDVLTNNKRVVGESALISEGANRRVLKG